MRNHLLAAVFLCALAAPAARAQTFTTVDDPNGADQYGDNNTWLTGIDDNGDMVGYYNNPNYQVNPEYAYTGFILLGGPTGTFTDIVEPNASTQAFFGGTQVNGISSNGSYIVGNYSDGAGDQYGFILSGYTISGTTLNLTNASFTTLTGPTAANNAGGSGTTNLTATGVNSSGEAVGYYENANGTYDGFTEIGGVYTTVDGPIGLGTTSTLIYGVNDNGATTGLIDDNNGTDGFINDTTGFNTITALSGTGATPSGINNSETVVGCGYPQQTTIQSEGGPFTITTDVGFSYSASAGLATIADSGFGPFANTCASGINDGGAIVGTVSEDDPDGFLLTSNNLTPVPEPASFALLGGGLLGLAAVRRRLSQV